MWLMSMAAIIVLPVPVSMHAIVLPLSAARARRRVRKLIVTRRAVRRCLLDSLFASLEELFLVEASDEGPALLWVRSFRAHGGCDGNEAKEKGIYGS